MKDGCFSNIEEFILLPFRLEMDTSEIRLLLNRFESFLLGAGHFKKSGVRQNIDVAQTGIQIVQVGHRMSDFILRGLHITHRLFQELLHVVLRVVKALQFELKIGMFLHRQSSVLRILRPALLGEMLGSK